MSLGLSVIYKMRGVGQRTSAPARSSWHLPGFGQHTDNFGVVCHNSDLFSSLFCRQHRREDIPTDRYGTKTPQLGTQNTWVLVLAFLLRTSKL